MSYSQPKCINLFQREEKQYYCTTSLLKLSKETATNNDDDDEVNYKAPLKENESKPKSRLAMMAEDWLEDEEDELMTYWERYDTSKLSKTKITGKTTTSMATKTSDATATVLSTEELLDRYLESRGIDRTSEDKHANKIQIALDKTQKEALTPSKAIAILEPVRPYLQFNTRLGGTTLLELARAYWELGDDDSKKGKDATSPKEEALDICQGLLYSPHRDIKKNAVDLIQNGSQGRWIGGGKSDLWKGLLDPKSWWN